jgi:hypothetical protein
MRELYDELRISTLFSAMDGYFNPDNGLRSFRPLFGRANTKNVTPRAWVTARDRKYAPLAVPPWQATASPAAGVIEIDPSRQFQSVLGLVPANQGAEREVTCSFQAKSTNFTLRQNSVVTTELA